MTGSILVVDGRWLDKLGLAARMGIDVVARQSFFHGHYALLDDYMYPRPVRSLSLLYIISRFLCSMSVCVAGDNTVL